MAKRHRPLAVVILAAGKGTRMKSDKPKVLFELAGMPMINWLLSSIESLNPDRVVTVIGPGMDDLASAVSPYETAVQLEQNGTAGALYAAMAPLQGFDGDILVLLGDTPLISTQTMENLIATRHQDAVTGIAVLGTEMDDPTGYGRLLIGQDGYLAAIREEKDASVMEKTVRLVNTGAFCLDSRRVDRWLSLVSNRNAQKEFYITDLPEIAARDGLRTRICVTMNRAEVQGVNTRAQLGALEAAAQNRLRTHFMENGVVMQDSSSVYLHYDTKIGAGTIVEPHVVIGPSVEIGENVHIKAFCHFEGAKISNGVTVGPFARLRPGAVIGEDARIGNFVEVKNSNIGNRSKINHLGYVGDCDMGDDVNFSCGAITVNYDGFQKHRTTIGKGVMIGSNVNLIAPVEVDDGAFIAAGSTITEDVPADALSVSRSKPEVRQGWAAAYRKRKEKNKPEKG
ncbi:MAG: bifunctional UDP-N-acetylglucosamine diphosphorylase/glucosamine-1-phosphate N-acetyltransferase GlmU [Alphaproteobacteria bacterium]|nr:bifunctional UDP-N-acetylglucosamine diphosphorylase/glucosamine-1-phosphate N-acetyltransferase GlmU [Alphaproteobacteria bacterium]